MKYPYPRYGSNLPRMVWGSGNIDNAPTRSLQSNSGAQFSTVGAWVGQSRIYYMPILTERAIVLKQFGWENGGTVSGRLAAGLYTWEGKALVRTDPTTQTPINDIQLVNTPDIAIERGIYYIALVCDNTTATVMKESSLLTGPVLRVEGMQVQDLTAGQATLPATATFANPSTGFVPLVFATLGASI